MEIGIFAKTFVRPSIAATLDAVAATGLRVVQWNMACAGLPSLPDAIEPALAATIQHELAARGLRMAAVSGTFNIIHPDRQLRDTGLRRLQVLAAACVGLGTSIITLSTGTRNPHDMWAAHPDNQSVAAWHDMVAAMREIAAIGQAHDVTMAFEPEVGNVVDGARKARRLLDELASPYVKVVLDGANLLHTGQLAAMRAILDEAFTLLGGDIILAHAKDRAADGTTGQVAAGQGILDYPYYLKLLHQVGYSGPLILHGLREEQVAESVAFLRSHLPF
jgi:sugar phosphate isomerase/epimerase